MKTFRINYKLESDFHEDIEAETEEEARAIFAQMDHNGYLSSSGELRSGWFNNNIISVEPVTFKTYTIDYQYTVFCRKIVSAISEEEAKQIFEEVGFETDDEYDSTRNLITKIEEVMEK